jgi:O-phosphoseryl-tRNA(Cys) synthetase
LSDFHQNIPKIVEYREPGAKVPFWLFSTNRGFRREKLQKASVLKILHGGAYVFWCQIKAEMMLHMK